MTDASASGGELVAVAREFARKGGFFPTPGQLVEAIRERRLQHLREERERSPHDPLRLVRPTMSDERHLAAKIEWSVARNILSPDDSVPSGWTAGFANRDAIWESARDLARRGHRGTFGGESIAAALDRERRDLLEASSRGEDWSPPVYGKRRVEGGAAR